VVRVQAGTFYVLCNRERTSKLSKLLRQHPHIQALAHLQRQLLELLQPHSELIVH
jgi:hypothetical protein